MNELSETVERLATRIEALERRVSALETVQPVAELPFAPDASAPSVLSPDKQPASGTESSVFVLAGKAMLCIAGAYLFRAAVQSAALPRWPTVVASVLYAFVWLYPATHVSARAWFRSAVWAGTSVLILIPMLWELTLRFSFLPPSATAAILGAFVLAGMALAWKRNFSIVIWIVVASASLAALVLSIATRDLVPFLALLLLVVLVIEAAACSSRLSGVRFIAAFAADITVFALLWIYSGSPSARTDYPPLAAPLLLSFAPVLLAIYALSAAVQTLLQRQAIGLFQVAQTLIAALFTVWSILAFWPGHGSLVLGLTCLFASAGGYLLTFAWFDRTRAQRNYHVYATGTLALLLAGLILSLPPVGLALCSALLAGVMVALGRRTAHSTLFFHGLALLLTAAGSSGLFASIARSLMGTQIELPGRIVTITGAAAILSCASLPAEKLGLWWGQMLRLLFAALAVASFLSFLIPVLVHIASVAVAPAAEHIAVIRTVAICVVALSLAWCGSRWRRKELVWLTWLALALNGGKLLLEDLRHGHLGFTATSISLYALTLLLVPRLLRVRSAVLRDGSI
jgi:hypothetical protein